MATRNHVNPDLPVFARRLKTARLALGFTQVQLAIQAGMDESSASARMAGYEAGKHLPEINVAQQLANTLGMPLAYFFCEDNLLAQIIHAAHGMNVKQKNRLLDWIQHEKQ